MEGPGPKRPKMEEKEESKTPVSLLQEILMRQGKSPIYEVISVTEQSHKPEFMYRVTVDGILEAFGRGLSKKAAKHAAAQAALDIFGSDPALHQYLEGTSTVKIIGNVRPELEQEPHVVVNSVGALSEACIAGQHGAPIYNVVNEEGPPHAKLFTFACTVGDITEEGTDKSKKLAKHRAASQVLMKLKAADVGANDMEQASYCEPKAFLEKIDAYVKKASQEQQKDIPIAHLSFMLSLVTGEKMDQVRNKVVDYEKLLTEVCAEQKYQIIFKDYSNPNCGHLSMLTLKGCPVPCTVSGIGRTLEESREAAVKEAIRVLNILANAVKA